MWRHPIQWLPPILPKPLDAPGWLDWAPSWLILPNSHLLWPRMGPIEPHVSPTFPNLNLQLACLSTELAYLNPALTHNSPFEPQVGQFQPPVGPLVPQVVFIKRVIIRIFKILSIGLIRYRRILHRFSASSSMVGHWFFIYSSLFLFHPVWAVTERWSASSKTLTRTKAFPPSLQSAIQSIVLGGRKPFLGESISGGGQKYFFGLANWSVTCEQFGDFAFKGRKND